MLLFWTSKHEVARRSWDAVWSRAAAETSDDVSLVAISCHLSWTYSRPIPRHGSVQWRWIYILNCSVHVSMIMVADRYDEYRMVTWSWLDPWPHRIELAMKQQAPDRWTRALPGEAAKDVRRKKKCKELAPKGYSAHTIGFEPTTNHVEISAANVEFGD